MKKISLEAFSIAQTSIMDEITTVILAEVGEFHFEHITLNFDYPDCTKIASGVISLVNEDMHTFEVNIKGEVALSEQVVPF